MHSLFVFLIEVALSLGVSAVLILILRPLLLELLAEICGTRIRAEFWVTFTQLMLVISPLLIVVFYAPTEPLDETGFTAELQGALFRILLGDFIALVLIGQVIWKSIDSPDAQEVSDIRNGES